MGVCPYNSWCKEEAIEVCVAVCMGFAPLPMVPEVGTQGALLHLVWKGWFMKPTSSVRYTILIIYNHNKRQQPIVSLGRGQATVMGCWKYTPLI